MQGFEIAGTHRKRYDPDGKNTDRALWADDAIAVFMDATGTDREDALADLLCDLMHWCDAEAAPFTDALHRASSHYLTETSKEG